MYQYSLYFVGMFSICNYSLKNKSYQVYNLFIKKLYLSVFYLRLDHLIKIYDLIRINPCILLHIITIIYLCTSISIMCSRLFNER